MIIHPSGGIYMKYDFLIVGAGLFGAIFAYEAKQKGYRCLVIDRRDHIGGNIYTEETEGIQVHKYGAHIFHTDDQKVWNYINQFAPFNRFTNAPLAKYKGKLYNLPFNMNTFNQMWGVTTPKEAKEKIAGQVKKYGVENPQNLEEQAISLVGKDIYDSLIKGYTEKQWGRLATELPAFIVKRLPVRFTYDNNYFKDRFQGIPIGGYTQIITKMLEGTDVKLNVDYIKNKKQYAGVAKKILFTGMIDEYYDYCYGELDYRSLQFETKILDSDNYQGNAVINYTERDVPYTRIIEHKHFEYGTQAKTVITKEYPKDWKRGDEPFYPINDQKNNALFERYMALSEKEKHVFFGGRLAMYKYYDMDDIIVEALACAKRQL